MHILLYHNAVIPPPKYGGTERVIYYLAKALALLGNRVSLIAREGSVVPGVEVIPLPKNNAPDWQTLIPKSTDILHLWSTPGNLPRIPFLVTIEGNGQVRERFHPNTVFVSAKHAANHGSENFVHNGIDPEDFQWDEKKDDYFVFLAKANWKVKNLKGAIELSRAANIPLEVMGSREWPLQIHRLFPRWGGVHYRGMVGDIEKRQVLRKAKALLFPVLWHEPFGVAIIEALASGCAVFGTPYGSLPEIITPEVGKLSSSADDLLMALSQFDYSPSACRKRVYEGFTHINMAEKYLTYYKRILDKGTLQTNGKEVQALSSVPPETLLPWQTLKN